MAQRGRGWTVYVERTRNKKAWRCRWEGRYGTGQQVFVFKNDAEELRLEKRRDFQRMDAGLQRAPKAISSLTVGEWWDKYSKTKRVENPGTFKRFDTPALEPFVEKHRGVALVAIGEDEVRDYKLELEQKYSGDTPRMYYRQVVAFFNAAVRAGEISASPARSVRKPISKGESGRPLLDSEILPLMTLAPESLLRTSTFSLNTMLRINEVLMLDWAWTWELEAIDKEGSRRRVLMGRIPHELRKTRSKSEEDCVFPINAAAEAVMGTWRPAGRVFPYSASTIQHALIAVRRKAKLPEDITFHCFRHTGASRYLAEGGHVEDLLKSRIWEDVRSLLRYVKPTPLTLYTRFSALSYPSPTPPEKKPAASS